MPDSHLDRTGRSIGVYAFVMVLSFSRMMFVRFTTSMALGELIGCHQKAFDYFGGWPGVVLYDNMKQVKLSAAEWNQAFLDFAGHYGFTPKTCRIRRARTKGKVERMVDYVKDNLLNGREFADLDDLNVQALAWLNATANVRVHATTQRRPVDLLGEEHLRSVGSIAPYRFVERHPRKVGAESMVSFGSSRYSVPPAYVGRDVTVSHEDLRIVVRAGDLVIAEHAPSARRGSCVSDKAHVADLWKLSLGRAPDPVPSWKLTFNQQVAMPPLDRYEQLTTTGVMP
jgi:Integrase core domain